CAPACRDRRAPARRVRRFPRAASAAASSAIERNDRASTCETSIREAPSAPAGAPGRVASHLRCEPLVICAWATMTTRRDAIKLLLIGVAWLLWPSRAHAASLPATTQAALRTSDYIYVATRRKNGALSSIVPI